MSQPPAPRGATPPGHSHPWALAALLVLPLTLLLCVQWPLRDWVHAYSRQANDVAQILFGLYMALAVTAASVAKTHLALVKPAQQASKTIAKRRAWWTLLCVGPWSLFLLWTAVPQMLASIRALEIFSEGLTPGYFLLRVALVLLAVLVLAQALLQARDAERSIKASQ